FRALDKNGRELTWEKTDSITWMVKKSNSSPVYISYRVKASRPFVATSFLNEERGYIMPASLLLYVKGKTGIPAELTIRPYKEWNNVATGLDTVKGKRFTYRAPDFDILYDSPILI